MMNHTPGPWKFIEGAAMVRGRNDQAHVCDIRGFGCTDDECAANGRLIASAPELLAALGELIEQLEGIPDWHGAEGLSLEQSKTALEMARG